MPKLGSTRSIFIRAYELTFGNVSQSCQTAGISRQTFYRWMNSTTRINQRFRKRLESTRPEEAHIDYLEAAHTELVNRGDPAAVIFGLKTKGKKRGLSERFDDPGPAAPQTPDLDGLKTLIEHRAIEKGISFNDELLNFLSRFGERLPAQLKTALSSEQAQ